jgi:integrase
MTMGTITVRIYERVKSAKRWSTVPVEIPELKKDGTLFLQGDRQGKYRISWYYHRKKEWQTVKSRVREKEPPWLSDAIRQASDKAWYLNNRHHNVPDPTVAAARKKLADEILAYIDAKSGCKKTVSAHRLALMEFQTWATQQKGGHAIQYVYEITKPLLRRFFEQLVDGDEEEDGSENTPFTAAHKVMKVNAFYRAVFNLEPGKGVVTKKDYKRELKSSKVPEIYAKQEIDTMFAVMDEDEHLIFSTLYEAGLRKKELMHLEETDLILDERVPGCFKCEIRVQSKPHWKFQTKTGSSRNVLISRT